MLGIDFITPMVNGVTKHMLKHNLKSMLDPISGNMAYRRGKRVFELNYRIVKQLYTLIFLVKDNNSYAVFLIGDDGQTLTPYKFDISKYTTYFDIWGGMADTYRVNPSVVKSDSRNQNHIYTIENIRIDIEYFQPGYDLGYPQYGRRIQSYDLLPTDKLVAIGLRNCFIKAGANDIFDYNTSYLNYPLGQASEYICSGRHSSYIDEIEGLITNLYLWRIDVTSGQIKYTTLEGEQDGAIVSFKKQHDIYAILSPDKFIGVDKNNFEDYDNSEFYSGWWCGINDLRTLWEYGNKYKYFFGESIIEQYLGSFYSEHYTNLGEENPDCWQVECETATYSHRNQLVGKVYPLDYDNINIDESFILIYSFEKTLNHYLDVGKITGFISFLTEPNQWFDVKRVEYKIAYRVNGGDVSYITICFLMGGEKQNYIKVFPPYLPDCPSWGWVSGTTTFVGSRISDISCQATDKYLLYTYTLWEYTGPSGETHFNDMDNTLWTFEKRVLGIISIETGVKTEYEVNDEFLTDMYNGTFDEEQAAAMGLHELYK